MPKKSRAEKLRKSELVFLLRQGGAQEARNHGYEGGAMQAALRGRAMPLHASRAFFRPRYPPCPYKSQFLTLRAPIAGKVHGSLSRAGKVKGQTPDAEKQAKRKKPRGRAFKRMQYNKRFNVAKGPGKPRGPNSQTQ